MSLVHEALKKANTSQDRAAEAPQQHRLGPEVQGAPRKRSSSALVPVFLVLFALLITGPIVAPMLTQRSGAPASPTATAVTTQASSNRLGQFAVEELPLPASFLPKPAPAPTVNRPGLSLSGIVHGADGATSYCLINGEVYRVGDALGDLRVLGIDREEVVLDRNGERVILAVGDRI
ncbi:MAG: hypothetical protein MOGMAGMI_00908 [Candidatus Omnitrophica bacterium]|nr:hypothetical protein [Candidatus Omnitrophota bacterium]